MSISFPSDADVQYLISKYSSNGPSYYSYPTVVGFDDLNDSKNVFVSDVLESSSSSLSLYINIPYCQQLCYYCGCNREVTKDRAKGKKLIDGLKKEVALKAPFFKGRTVKSLHVGGGSPNFLENEDFVELMDFVRTLFEFDSEAALSIELDPRTTLKEQIELYANYGFSRVSYGVQDFNSEVQKAINRIQPKEIVYDLVEIARQSGFLSINIDLVYGLPLQTRETFRDTLEDAVSLGTSRVVVTKYSHLPAAFPNQRLLEGFIIPDSLSKMHMIIDAINILRGVGYEYIGVDHFALPDDSLAIAKENRNLLRNFLGYDVCHSKDILGLGPYSISEINGNFYQNTKNVNQYLQEVRSGKDAISKYLKRSSSDRVRWNIIHEFLCYGEIAYKKFGGDFKNFQELFWREMIMLRDFESDGLVNIDSGGLALTGLGRVFIRNICMAFDEKFCSQVYDERFPKTV
ncbi:oxygen-independent coproporphyrinogen III oxidase [Pseudomonas aeruginosa]|uniref:oxygen-independent coproporphyrinogen III oxidase n=1 Tax=Pseudomonas aeruginosa TaxID=287 RepID=UPI004046E251